MKYYVIDKIGNKAYGPLASRQLAEEAIGDAVDLAVKVIATMSTDIKVEQTQKLDETEIKANGEVVSIYEIITADQFDHPDQIPTEFQ